MSSVDNGKDVRAFSGLTGLVRVGDEVQLVFQGDGRVARLLEQGGQIVYTTIEDTYGNLELTDIWIEMPGEPESARPIKMLHSARIVAPPMTAAPQSRITHGVRRRPIRRTQARSHRVRTRRSSTSRDDGDSGSDGPGEPDPDSHPSGGAR